MVAVDIVELANSGGLSGVEGNLTSWIDREGSADVGLRRGGGARAMSSGESVYCLAFLVCDRVTGRFVAILLSAHKTNVDELCWMIDIRMLRMR